MVNEIMETNKEIAEASRMYCTVQITSEVKDVETEKTIAKIADAYKSMYNRASQTLDVSRIDSTQVTGLIDELKKASIQAKPMKSEMLESLHERMDKIVGKNDAVSQPADTTKKKKESEDEEPQEPVIQKESVEDIFSKYDPYELLIGATVELEHTDSVTEALKISIDHLEELPDYYSKLLTYVEPEEDPVEDLKGKQDESSEPGKEYTPEEKLEYVNKTLEELDYKEYQTPGGSNINVGRMIKNMSRMKMPKFDSKRNLADRFKIMFKMRSPKDDMNAALNSNREEFNIEPGEWVESYTIIGKFEEEKEANDVLKALLNKKRSAQMMTDKDGKKVIIVEENYKEDNTMGNSKDITTTKQPGKRNYVDTKKKAEELIKKYKPKKDNI